MYRLRPQDPVETQLCARHIPCGPWMGTAECDEIFIRNTRWENGMPRVLRQVELSATNCTL